MNTSTAASASLPIDAGAKRSFALVFICTLFGAAAQILIKLGTSDLGGHITLGQVVHSPGLFFTFCLGVISNGKLFTGYCLYAVNTFLMALALKGRELSRLYPIIALTYVWVTFMSLFALPGEHLNFFRCLGITLIVVGVSILGLKR